MAFILQHKSLFWREKWTIVSGSLTIWLVHTHSTEEHQWWDYLKYFNFFSLLTFHLFSDIEFTGGVPYVVLRPILEKATPEQLIQLEYYNPYLLEDTDELWKIIAGRSFRAQKREEGESWREMYMVGDNWKAAKIKNQK